MPDAGKLENVSESGGSAAPEATRSSLHRYLTVAAPIFFGLFFIEYPPLFLFGYWSWSGDIHKVLSGVFLILNLALAEWGVRRSRSHSDSAKSDGDGVQESVKQS